MLTTHPPPPTTSRDESDILNDMKEAFGGINSHIRIAIERFEKSRCDCLNGAKGDVADEKEGEGVELAPVDETQITQSKKRGSSSAL